MTSAPLRRALRVACLLGAMGAPLGPACAQREAASPYRHRVLLTLGAGTLPDAFTCRCGRADIGDTGTGVGVAALTRLRGWLVLQADAHMVTGYTNGGCTADLPSVMIGPNVYETRPGAEFPRGTPSTPRLARTTLRVGAETPPTRPLLRATIGGGAFWGGRPAPVGVVTLGTGTRGRRARFYAEGEAAVTRIAGTERRERWQASTTGSTSLGVTVVPVVFRPVFMTLNVGVEIPLHR